MTQGLDPRYASPGLRWGLLLEDHPGATYKPELLGGNAVGIPAAFGGDGPVCVITIAFPQRKGEAQRAPVVAYKPVPPKGTADDWNVLVTKTLGRALKKAGYPDNLQDLKALVLWRQRDAEIQAITAGVREPIAAIGPASSDDLDAAGTHDPDHVGADDGAVDPPDESADDPTMRRPDENTLAELRAAIGSLPRDQQPRVTHWCQDNRMKVTKPQTEAEAQQILAYAQSLTSPTDDDVAEPCAACSSEPCECAPEGAQLEGVA